MMKNLILGLILLFGLSLQGCKKEDVEPQNNCVQISKSLEKNKESLQEAYSNQSYYKNKKSKAKTPEEIKSCDSYINLYQVTINKLNSMIAGSESTMKELGC